MNWYTLFYLFSILEKIHTALIIFGLLTTAIFLITTVVFYVQKSNLNDGDSYEQESAKKWLNTIKWPRVSCGIIGLLIWLMVIFIPSRKDMIIIIAGGAVGEFVSNDENAKQLPADITRFLRGEILKATAELTDEAKTSIGIKTEAEKLKELSREELEKMLLEKIDKK